MNEFEIKEKRATKGATGGIYVMDETDGKYYAMLATTKYVVPKTSMSEIEIKVVNSAEIGKIDGVETVEASETDVYMHRDSINTLEKLKGKLLHLMSVSSDKVGFKFDGTISYTPNEAEMDAAWMGTVKITPRGKPEYIENCLDMLKPSVKFVDAISPDVELETTKGTSVQVINTNPTDANVTVKSDDEKIATASYTDGKVTITGVATGSTIVRYKATKEGYANAETTTLVIVPKAETPTA